MDQNAKSQAIEQIKKAQNVLVTVSDNPSVDQLSAAIGFTLLLNKLNKHATAVFSGQVPSTLEFLKPEDTLEGNTDSLRDFIVSLDKSKADKLRYKVEDDVVRIYITPYRTSLSDNDLSFSQGDFNVDVVIALGVEQQDNLDKAIIEHGRILHDATIVSVIAGGASSDLGGINWQDPNASSLCEMLMGISESLKSGVIDDQIATALLTGIVAETERFSNSKTTPKAMTMSAQLMSAGANQQLVSESLTEPEPEPEVNTSQDDGELSLADVEGADYESSDESEENGVLNLHHERDGQEEQPLETEKVEDHHIGIEGDGKFNNADQLRQAVENVQQTSQGSFKGKTIKPPEDYDAPAHLPNIDGSTSYEDYNDNNQGESESPELPQVALQQPQMPADQKGEAYVDPNSLPPAHDEDLISEEEAGEVLKNNQSNDDDLPEVKPEHARSEFIDHPPSTDTPDEVSPEQEELPSYEQKQKFSKYLDKPSVDAPKLNAIESQEDGDLTVDPLSGIPSSGPIEENPNKSTESPLLTTQHDAESAPPPTTTESPRLSDDGISKGDSPLGPAVDSTESLAQIEDEVKAFEEGAPPAADDARNAVQMAMEGKDASFDALQFEALATDPETKQTQDNPYSAPDTNSPPQDPPPFFPPPTN